MTIKDVFDYAANGNFSHYMNEFAHAFLWDADFDMVKDEPCYYDSISADNYVYAACFVHYWCDVLLMPIPKWVFLENYRHTEPVYTYNGMKEELERVTPKQFKFHNRFMRSSEVLCI